MEKKKTIPIYKKIFNDLKKQIDEGKYSVGDILPSENELSGRYKITRMTVRLALNELTKAGYIKRHHGKGSIVAEAKKGLGILSVRGVTGGVGEKQLTTKIIQKPVKLSWPINFYYPLSEKELNLGCLFLTRVRIINNSPVLFEETHITNDNLSHFINLNLENKSLFNTLREQSHVEILGGEQKIWALKANKYISHVLKIDEGSPVVHMQRKLQTNQENVNIYSSLYCNTSEYYLQDYF